MDHTSPASYGEVCPDKEVIDRLRGRRALLGRPDDQPEVLRQRLTLYRQETARCALTTAASGS